MIPPRIKQATLSLLIITIAISIGLVFRMISVEHLNQENSGAFTKGQPNLATLDGYYYASTASQIVSKEISESSHYQYAPTPPKRQSIPLLSIITAQISKITGLGINWVAYFLPPMLGCLLAIPLFYLGHGLGGKLLGALMAIYGLLPLHYVYRTRPGWLDTDTLNLVFPYFAILIGFKLLNSNKKWTILAPLIGVTNIYIFNKWWDQTNIVPLALGAYPILAAFIIRLRTHQRISEKKLVFQVAASVAITLLIASLILNINELFNIYNYISGSQLTPYPNIADTVSEQKAPTWPVLIEAHSGNYIAFIIAIIGLILLFINKPSLMLISLPLIALSLMGFFVAKRFMLFTNPLMAIGSAYFVYFVIAQKSIAQKLPARGVIGACIAVFLFWSYHYTIKSNKYYPAVASNIVEGVQELARITEDNALIWSWWDNGYLIQYEANRSTISDGRYHSGALAYFNALPFLTNSPVLARNFIRFYAGHGVERIERTLDKIDADLNDINELIISLLSVNRHEATQLLRKSDLYVNKKVDDELLSFLFDEADTARPIYLFLDFNMMRSSHWWSWLASWDFDKRSGTHSYLEPYFALKAVTRHSLTGTNGLKVNLLNRTAEDKNQRFSLNRILLVEQADKRYTRSSEEGSYIFVARLDKEFGAVLDERMGESLFARLFVSEDLNSPYFEPISLNPPYYQIWRVK